MTHYFQDAANDAHCALTVYNRLLGMANTSQRELIPLTYTANVETEYREKKYSKDKSTRSTVVGSSLGLDKSSTGPSSSYRRYPAEEVRPGSFPRPQHMRAYTLWHHSDMPLKDICAKLRSEENPLKESTVM